MYGLLLMSIRDAIIANYGQQTWLQIEEFINIESDSILAKKIYHDSLFDQIIKALMMLNQAGDTEIYMELFGKSFIGHISTYGYEKILRSAGRHLRNFLHSIDQIHQSNRFSFPQMKHPLFYVQSEDSDGLFLHYQSRRRGFNSYVIGQLKECARKYFKQEIRVKIYKDISDNEFNHVIFRVEFDNSEYVKSLDDNMNMKCHNIKSSIKTISTETLLNILPCCLVIDKNLKINYASQMFYDLFGDSICENDLDQAFKMLRPNPIKNWEEMVRFSHSLIFELTNLIETKQETDKRRTQNVVFRGQMKLVKELKMALFIGHPVLNSMDEMPEVGLFLNNLNNYDSSVELLVNQMQSNFELKKAMKTQREWTINLERTKTVLRCWRRKKQSLLNSMLPKHIARQIEEGAEPGSLSVVLDSVTVLFIRLVGIQSVLDESDPIKAVQLINSTFMAYDKIVETYENVCKIVTKADGWYMIATGIDKDQNLLAEKSELNSSRLSLTDLDDQEPYMEIVEKKHLVDYNQTELVAEVALDILKNVKGSKETLSCQMGFHSGKVVAGVVGTSSMQFCLFGETVNAASCISENSEPGKICFSESSFKMIKNSKYFTVELRDKKHLSDTDESDLYWLNGKR